MPHAFTRLGPLFVLALLIGVGPVLAELGAPLASSDTNTSGVSADVTECKRKEGVLTLKIRLRNTGTSEARLGLIASRSYDKYYLTAGSKKYFILRDTEKTPLASAADNIGDLDVHIPANGAYTWWAKYPAPPADVKAVNVYTPIAPPIDDVPITDS
jgi:hypothetical protein